MKNKWIPAGLIVGLLAAAITGGAVMASGGEPEESEAPEEVIVTDTDTSTASIVNDDVDAVGEPDELSVRVAEILGTDPQATHDAMVEADRLDPGPLPADGNADAGDADSASEHAEGMSYAEYGNRVGAILGLDGLRVAEAIAQAYQELYGVERDIRDTGSGRDAEGKEDPAKRLAQPDSDG